MKLLRRSITVGALCLGALLPALLGGCLSDSSDDLVVRLCSPDVGSNAGGTLIHVEGRGFESDARVVFLFSSGTRVTATDQFVASSKVIVARSPEPGAGTGGTVTVEVHSGGAVAALPGGFRYTSLPPTISAIVPNTGPATGGTAFTITGSGFLTNPAVTIGGQAATSIARPDPNTITGLTPVGGAGSADVTVINTDSGSATLPGGFTYVGPPVIGGITPNGGPTIGGTRITLTGSGYQPGATVSIGGAAAFNVIVSPVSIICQTPTGTAGTQSVVVTNVDSQSATSSGPGGGYTYRATRLYVAHADAPNNRLMVLDYNDATHTLSNPSGMSSPASTNGAGSPALAAYTDTGLTAGVAEVVYVTNFSSDSVSIFHVSSSTGAATLQGTPVNLTGGAAPREPVLSRIHVTSGGTRVLYLLGNNGYVYAFAVTASSGALTAVSGSPFQLSTIAGTPAPTDWAITGNSLFVADFGRDLIAGFTIAADGSLTSMGTPTTLGANDGPGVLHVWPGGQFLYSANSGTGTDGDKIGGWTVGASSPLAAIAGQPFTAGTGPLGMDDDGANLYVANSGAGTVQGFAVAATPTPGVLAASTAVATDSGGSPLPAVVKSRFDALLGNLYALNTGTNTIAGFTTGTNGSLVALSGSPTALTGASAVVSWAWGANTVLVLDGNGAQVIAVDRNVTTGALSLVTSGTKSTLGTVAADLLLSR